jgi:hypothetical protein
MADAFLPAELLSLLPDEAALHLTEEVSEANGQFPPGDRDETQ